MNPTIWLFGAGALLLAIAFLTRLILSARARTAARKALDSLFEEFESARSGRDERYWTKMPGKAGFENEKECVRQLLPHLEERYKDLVQRSFWDRLRPSWAAACRTLAKDARIKLRSLQDEAFWAQFRPGSAAADCRFDEPE